MLPCSNLVDFVNLFCHISTMATRKQIDQFRHFNRFYTDYLGLLGNSLYDSPVNLAEARILYELDKSPGSPAREIRQRLSLDKGYLSRMLKLFVKKGWIESTPAATDARVKELRLTNTGAALMEQLHADARKQAKSALTTLSIEDKARLLSAMATIEDILSP